jgi:hypothetical protein
VKPTDAERGPAFDRLVARGLAGETGDSGVACPDADLLAAWFDHSLSAAETERIEAHVSFCGACQQILGDLARSEPEVTRAAPLPAPARPWHWHWRWLVPLTTAAIVVVVAQRTLRAPGDAPAGAPVQPGLAQPSSSVAEMRDQAAPAKSAGEMARVVRPAEPAARQAKVSDKSAVDRARTDVKPVGGIAGGVPGGVVGGVVGGVEKGRAEVVAENVATAAPTQALPTAVRMAAAPKPESAARDAAELVRATSGVAPSGATGTWRYGQSGVIERSADGGRTWERQRSGVTTPLADGSAATDLVCWIVGASGVVLRTTDGRTWERLPSPTSADLVSVHAWSESVATITAVDRTEYETTNGGQSWRRREPGLALLP